MLASYLESTNNCTHMNITRVDYSPLNENFISLNIVFCVLMESSHTALHLKLLALTKEKSMASLIWSCVSGHLFNFSLYNLIKLKEVMYDERWEMLLQHNKVENFTWCYCCCCSIFPSSFHRGDGKCGFNLATMKWIQRIENVDLMVSI